MLIIKSAYLEKIYGIFSTEILIIEGTEGACHYTRTHLFNLIGLESDVFVLMQMMFE